MFASVPLIPKFASGGAASPCELRNRDTSVLATPRRRLSSRVATPPIPPMLTARSSQVALRRNIAVWPTTSLCRLKPRRRRSGFAHTTSRHGSVATTSAGQIPASNGAACGQPESPSMISMRSIITGQRRVAQAAAEFQSQMTFLRIVISLYVIVGA